MIGLVTIGQAPREDVLLSMFGSHSGSTYLQAGALDGLSDAEIAELRPQTGEYPLVTRLRDGSEVVIAKQRITTLVNAAIAQVEAAGATITCVLCTGEFEGLEVQGRLVYPDRVIAGVVDGLLTTGTLGVMIPNQGQREGMLTKWARPGREVKLTVVSPYDGADGVTGATEELVAQGAQLVVLDCMGYTEDMRRAAQDVSPAPVILSNRLVGAVLDAVVPDLAHLPQHS